MGETLTIQDIKDKEVVFVVLTPKSDEISVNNYAKMMRAAGGENSLVVVGDINVALRNSPWQASKKLTIISTTKLRVKLLRL